MDNKYVQQFKKGSLEMILLSLIGRKETYGYEIITELNSSASVLGLSLIHILLPQAWQAGWLCAAGAGPDRKAESKHGVKLAERSEAL